MEFTCKGCDEVLEVSRDEPIHGRCADCWDDFESQDLEDQFEELMEL